MTGPIHPFGVATSPLERLAIIICFGALGTLLWRRGVRAYGAVGA